MRHLFSLPIRQDQDVVTARQRAAQIAQLLGFDVSEQTRIATAVSEIVRNAFRYAKGGSVSFDLLEEPQPQQLVVRVADEGAGIRRLDDVLSGRYRSSTGMGLGIVGARRLMDSFSIDSGSAGTTVVLRKDLPPRAPRTSPERVGQIVDLLARKGPAGVYEELQHQNRELLRALGELESKQHELMHLNRELEDTNRGVVALYAELDEKADHLRRADELKSRFLSNMTHEFRTPVNSIIGLSNLLIDDAQRDGREPAPEVTYIRQAAEQLSELVNDLLDLAKVEAGKTVVRAAPFEVDNLFGALRGMLRPLLLNQSVALVFEDALDLPTLNTDEAKVSQILRNLISNALKFTERGEVRVSASMSDRDGQVTFAVSDTGIGIAEEDQARVFEEFTQLEHRLQRKVRGTGLGLPLSQKLAELLHGRLTVQSQPGVGSTFFLTIPASLPAPAAALPEWTPLRGKVPLLVVEDAADAQYFFEKVLRPTDYQIYPASTVAEAEAALERISPAIVILDIVLGRDSAWHLLARLRSDERTRHIPVIAVSSAPEREKAFALGAQAFLAKPIDRRLLLTTLNELRARITPALRVLVIDDEEVARFLVRQCLPRPLFDVAEAASGESGLQRARSDRPDVVLLDLVMNGVGGVEVLQRLRQDSLTRDIPVIIVTSQALDDRERTMLSRDAQGIVSKAEISRGTLAEQVRRVAAHQGTGGDEAMAPPRPL
jgi:signal transduction histidine kinase/DNA-binding response OmpR family regulator